MAKKKKKKGSGKASRKVAKKPARKLAKKAAKKSKPVKRKAAKKKKAKGAATPAANAFDTAVPKGAKAFAGAPAAVEQRSLVFSIDGEAPKLVRVTLGSEKELVLLNDTSFPSKPRAKNTQVSANVEIVGNSEQTTKIKVTNSLPDGIQITIPKGHTNHSAPKDLLVFWK